MNMLGRFRVAVLLLGWGFGVCPWGRGFGRDLGCFVWGFCGVGVSVGAVHNLGFVDL